MKTIIFIFLILCSTNSSEKLYTEGNKYFEAKEYTDAMYSFVLLLKENPDFKKSDEIKFKIAQCFEFQNLPKQASVWYEKIIKENQESNYIKEAETKIKELKSAIEKQEQVENTERVENITTVIHNTQSYKSIQTTEELTDEPEAEKLYQKAVKQFEEVRDKKAIGTDPLSPYRQVLGTLRNVMHRFPMSRQTKESENLIAECYKTVADRERNEKDYKLAQNIYEKILKECSQSRLIDYAQYQISRCLEFQRKSKEAIEEFRKVILKYPRSELADNAYERIGSLYAYLGDLEKANQEYNNLIKNYPNSEMCQVVQHYIGVNLYSLQKYKEALQTFKTLIQKYPNSGYVQWAKEYIDEIHKKGIK